MEALRCHKSIYTSIDLSIKKKENIYYASLYNQKAPLDTLLADVNVKRCFT